MFGGALSGLNQLPVKTDILDIQGLIPGLSKGWSPAFFEGISKTLESLLKLDLTAATALVEAAKSLQPAPLTYKSSELPSIIATFKQSAVFSGKFFNQQDRRTRWVLTADGGYSLTWEKSPWAPYPEGGGKGTVRCRDWDDLLSGGPVHMIYLHKADVLPLVRGGETIGVLEFAEPLWPLGDVITEGYQIDVGPLNWTKA